MSPIIVWFRQDLRLADNPALAAALERGGPVVPVYILDDAGEGEWRAGGASRWWLHHSLAALDDALKSRGSRLLRLRGDSLAELGRLAGTIQAAAVFWNRRYEPAAVARDARIAVRLKAGGLEVGTFNSGLLFEPERVRNKAGDPFQVFTAFWRHCQTLPIESPVRAAAGPIPAPSRWPAGLELGQLALLPEIGWDQGFRAVWNPGEAGARKRWRHFLENGLDGYAAGRDLMAEDGTSALSPHLHFGEIGPRQIWADVRARSTDTGVFPSSRGAQVYLNEIGWREFAHHLLGHFPRTPTEPLREQFTRFAWREEAGALRAWQRGRTGYPVVDAAMRQLWQTGWMHNRARMIVASFLVKHLRLTWREGAAWFWDTLVDADLANNTLGWQWSAGCGTDAAPYFRIFNPTLQGGKFDPDGRYVRRWVPELAKLPARFVHEPWTAPGELLASAGIELGETYPRPIVDHAAARAAALAAFKAVSTPRP